MSKKLPKIKKTVSSFLTQEDAKLMNKTAAKLSVSLAFASSVIIFQAENGNALSLSHSNHSNHSNNINVHVAGDMESSSGSLDKAKEVPDGFGTKISGDLYQDINLFNIDENTKEVDLIHSGDGEYDLPPKSITSVHSNHVNHKNSGGLLSKVSGGLASFASWTFTLGTVDSDEFDFYKERDDPDY